MQKVLCGRSQKGQPLNALLRAKEFNRAKGAESQLSRGLFPSCVTAWLSPSRASHTTSSKGGGAEEKAHKGKASRAKTRPGGKRREQHLGGHTGRKRGHHHGVLTGESRLEPI